MKKIIIVISTTLMASILAHVGSTYYINKQLTISSPADNKQRQVILDYEHYTECALGIPSCLISTSTTALGAHIEFSFPGKGARVRFENERVVEAANRIGITYKEPTEAEAIFINVVERKELDYARSYEYQTDSKRKVNPAGQSTELLYSNRLDYSIFERTDTKNALNPFTYSYSKWADGKIISLSYANCESKAAKTFFSSVLIKSTPLPIAEMYQSLNGTQ